MSTQDKKQIEAYNLAEFCQLAQDHFNKGFTFDFADNAHYPTSFGSFFSAVMIKQKEALSETFSAVQGAQAEVVKQVQEAVEAVVQAQEAIVEASVGALEEAAEVLAAAPAKGRPKKV